MFLRNAAVFVGNVASFLRKAGSLQRKLVPLLARIVFFLTNGRAFPRNRAPFLAPATTSAANVQRMVGSHAASWTWDQAKQIPGGAWDGVKGMYEAASSSSR